MKKRLLQLLLDSSKKAFSPRDLPNLGLWLKADAGITLNTSEVSQWDDQSGNGISFTQSTGANQPTYEATGGPNSKPCVSFVAANLDFLLSGATSLYSLSTGYTFFIVMKANTGGTDNLAIDTDTDSFGIQQYLGNFLTRWNAISYSQAVQTDTTFKYYSVKFDGGGATNADKVKNWINGVSQSLTFVGAAPTSITSSSAWYLGRYFSGGFNFNGRICEIIAYTDKKSDSDRQLVEAYLARKYGL
jgi:trimeric autotransporter adhesin